MRIAASKRIRRDADIEVVLVVPALTQLFPSFRRAIVSKDLESWEKLLELHFPVHENTSRHNNQVRTPDAPIACQMGQKGDSLDGLPRSRLADVKRKRRKHIPKPHFICKDAIEIPFVDAGKPFQSSLLVRSQYPAK